jgi:nitrogen fixation NifU-like protein
VTVGFTPIGDDLYREIILDHYRNPRHRGAVEPADGHLEADNPLCGDEIRLTWRTSDGHVDVAFEGRGCSISQAAASLLCDAVAGSTLDAATDVVRRFRAMLVDGADPGDIGDLEALQGVAAYPVRVKCATLAANGLLQAFEGETTHG